MSTRRWGMVLILAIGLGGFLRVAHMPSVGLFAYDEGYFSELVKSWRAAMQFGAAHLVGSHPSLSFGTYMLEQGGQYYTAAKPTFVLMGTVGSYLFGFGEHTLPMVSAVAGLITIGVVFLIARRLSGWPAAAMSALALAVSCYHVTYSRSGFSLAVATALVYAAITLFQRAEASKDWRGWGWSGVCIGLAYTSHQGLFWVPPLCWLSVLIAGPAPQRLRRLMTMTLGMMTPLLLWEGVTRLVQWAILQHPAWVAVLQGPTGQGRYLSYLQELLMQKQVYGGPEPSSNQWTFYGGLVWNFERPLVLGLAAVGLGWALSRLRRSAQRGTLLVICGCAVVPWIVFGLMPHYPVARVTLPAIPALAILCGLGTSWLVQGVEQRGQVRLASVVGAVCAIAIASLGVQRSWPVLQAHSGFPQAVAYMAAHEGVRHLSSNEHLSRVYVGRANAADLHVSLSSEEDTTGKRHIAIQKLEALYRAGYRYVLLDGFRYRLEHELMQATHDVPPVFTAPHSTKSERYVYDVRRRYREDILHAPEVLEVYRLEDLLGRLRPTG